MKIDDKTLKQNVLDELEFEPSIDSTEIGVAVDQGIVTLTGHVASYAQKLILDRVVSQVKGVQGYAEEVEVRLPGTVSTSDDEIAKRAVNSIKWRLPAVAEKLQVKVAKGWITLTGTLDWNYQKEDATDAVRNLEGVRGIDNLIELRPRVTSGDVKKQIENALKRNAEVEASAIRVKVTGNKVTLEGNVKAWYERRIAERAAWSTPGVTMVDDHLRTA